MFRVWSATEANSVDQNLELIRCWTGFPVVVPAGPSSVAYAVVPNFLFYF